MLRYFVARLFNVYPLLQPLVVGNKVAAEEQFVAYHLR